MNVSHGCSLANLFVDQIMQKTEFVANKSVIVYYIWIVEGISVISSAHWIGFALTLQSLEFRSNGLQQNLDE